MMSTLAAPSRAVLALGLACAAAVPARATPPQDPNPIWTFQAENDAVSTQAGTSDRYYTSGLRIGYTSNTLAPMNPAARAGQFIWGDGVTRVSFDISQSLFTPANTQISPPNPRDRPYAGYLNATVSLLHDSDTSRSILAFSGGVVGQSALGYIVQNGFHNIIGDTPNKGWPYQLQDEPAVELLAERIWRLPLARPFGLEVDTLPALTAGVGTVRDYVEPGVVFRLGQGLNSDFGVARIRPGMSGTDAYTPTRPFVWYVFGGVDGQAIARDEFLDGSTFRSNSPHVTKKPFVGELEAGVGLIIHGVRVSYTQTWQTQEFEGQRSGLFNFGSVALSAHF
ncbi:MAG: lipid A deacylase LpxR family protein [Pseudomonadota bacterium]|nr:lipid A deacylase LpxR family protein [Pseudomonadota bacterium]